MYNCLSRYYDPVTGRFLNADGLISTGQGILGYNMYAYCNNNPINLSDPSGCAPVINSAWDAQRFKDKLKESGISLTSKTKQTIGALDPTVARAINIGKAFDYTNYTFRNVYMLEADATTKFKKDMIEFVGDKDLLIIDCTNINEVNYQVYNSYKYSDHRLLQETSQMIINYNNDLGRVQWDRSVDSLYREWLIHNALYIVTTGDNKERARHSDLDENAEPSAIIWSK